METVDSQAEQAPEAAFEVITWDVALGNATSTLTHDTRPDCWSRVSTHTTLAAAKRAAEKQVRAGYVGRIGVRTAGGERLPIATLAGLPPYWVSWREA